MFELIAHVNRRTLLFYIHFFANLMIKSSCITADKPPVYRQTWQGGSQLYESTRKEHYVNAALVVVVIHYEIAKKSIRYD